ncbi:MAG TPA: glycosyltransferase [Candidatus Krumholzibacteria bacterium]|nr:glycosyltransferase [Candidatus Krumholzibacteria bacterium]
MTAPPRLLVVSYHALPSVTPGSLRVQWMASQLAARGWDVTILTAAREPSPIPGVRVITTSRARQAGEASRAARRSSRLRTLWNDHAIPDRHVTWSRSLAAGARRILDEAALDVVLSTSPPHSSHLALARLRRRRAFHWATDFRDPWTAPARQARNPVSAAVQRRMEREVLAACDVVIANTEGNRDALRRAFPSIPGAKVHVVPNAFDDAMLGSGVAPATDDADLTYVGEVYPGMVDRLVAALGRLSARSPASVPRIAIHGEVDPREWNKIAAAGLAAFVELRGRVPHAESLRAMQRARALLLLLPDAVNWATCVPSKLYPYLASDRPVLAIVPEGDAARIVRAAGAGVAITTGGSDTTADAIAAFMARTRAGAEWRGRKSDVVAGYAASTLAARLDEILRGLVVRPS